MKKHNFLRKLYILVALLFVGQLIIPAYAAETEWTDYISEQEFFGEVLRVGNPYVRPVWGSNISVVHTSGTQTALNNKRIFLDTVWDFGMDQYKDYLQDAWESEGFQDYLGWMTTQTISGLFYIPSNARSGNYQLAAEVYFNDGIFAVYQLEFGSPSLVTSGDFYGPLFVSGNCLDYRYVSAS